MHFFACTRYWSPTPCPHIPAQKRYSWVMAFRRTVKVNVVQDPWARHSQPPVGKGSQRSRRRGDRRRVDRFPLPSVVAEARHGGGLLLGPRWRSEAKREGRAGELHGGRGTASTVVTPGRRVRPPKPLRREQGRDDTDHLRLPQIQHCNRGPQCLR
jgi:hypothetical protein